ncbi:hypothetical protein LIA77_09866 [Sarocladium implicatum]|nr:hypothetical protein LIA77_09866 [Sarocladium implicatum]
MGRWRCGGARHDSGGTAKAVIYHILAWRTYYLIARFISFLSLFSHHFSSKPVWFTLSACQKPVTCETSPPSQLRCPIILMQVPTPCSPHCLSIPQTRAPRHRTNTLA